MSETTSPSSVKSSASKRSPPCAIASPYAENALILNFSLRPATASESALPEATHDCACVPRRMTQKCRRPHSMRSTDRLLRPDNSFGGLPAPPFPPAPPPPGTAPLKIAWTCCGVRDPPPPASTPPPSWPHSRTSPVLVSATVWPWLLQHSSTWCPPGHVRVQLIRDAVAPNACAQACQICRSTECVRAGMPKPETPQS